MKKLSLVFALLIVLSAFLVPAVPTAQASTGVIDEIPVTLAPSDPCGGGQYRQEYPQHPQRDAEPAGGQQQVAHRRLSGDVA